MTDNRRYEQSRARENRLNAIKSAIDKNDPMGLLAMGAPSDEYVGEADIIERKIRKDGKHTCFYLKKLIAEVFLEQFDEPLDSKLCGKIANDIISGYGFTEFCDEFTQNEVLKDKIEISDDYTVGLRVHDDFVVEYFCEKASVNGKFFCDVEEQDLLDVLCGFCQNDTVYIQYKHKRLNRIFGFVRSYFKEVPKVRFSLDKVRHKKDVEKIFDKNGVIFDNSEK